MNKRKFVFDMETGDPDDFLTLALLGAHPEVDLVAVTVTPGTPHQIGIVRYGLQQLGLDIPVGAFNLAHKSGQDLNCVSGWHYKNFGDIAPSSDAEVGWEVLARVLGPDTTLVTGAPLKNIGALLKNSDKECFGKIFVQGGFAGEGVIPREDQLKKFKGMRTCPTYNLNGDPKSALELTKSNRFTERRFISKNVCHGVFYDQEMHATINALPNPGLGLQLIQRGMKSYKGSKKMHDPLAACCAIDPSIGTWANVDLFREYGKWGCQLNPLSKIQIITSYDHERFVKTLTA